MSHATDAIDLPTEITERDAKALIGGWKIRAANWLFSQGTSTVLLCAILGVNVWGGYYAMTTAIPQHINAIQAGYDRMDAKHTADMDRMAAHQERVNASHDRALEKVSDALDRLRDRQ